MSEVSRQEIREVLEDALKRASIPFTGSQLEAMTVGYFPAAPVEIENWSKPVGDELHIPDEFDKLMNYAGNQYHFCHISRAFSWQEMLARIILKCQCHFTGAKIKENPPVAGN